MTFGAGQLHLVFNHIIPDLGPILIALMIQDARRAVFMVVSLSFLGICDPIVVSWGKMMQHALKFVYLDVWRWWLLPTGFSALFPLLLWALRSPGSPWKPR